MFIQFDLRTTTHEKVIEAIRHLEAQNHVTSTIRHSSQLLEVWYEPKSEPQKSPESLSGYTQFAKKLVESVEAINKEPPKMSITGAPLLGDQFKSMLADVKSQIAQATNDMNSAMSELRDTATQATTMVKQIKDESAGLKAALGLSSNNPPA